VFENIDYVFCGRSLPSGRKWQLCSISTPWKSRIKKKSF